MALIVGIPNQALDANGAVMPFAEFHTFDADAPTTPKATYSDPGLTVEHTNPIVAGDDGYFPQAFAQEGQAFYFALTPENGDPDVAFQAYEQVWAVGGDETTAFERTFADARLRITSGEIEDGLDGVLIQAGRPAPLNVGGYLKEEGWAGTQLDKKITDAAVTEFTGDVEIGGDIKVGEFENAVPVVLARGTQAATASFDLALPAGYGSYEIHVRNFITVSTSAVQLHARLSFDDGATYKSGTADYQSQGLSHSSGSAQGQVATSATDMNLTAVSNNMGTASGGADISVELFTGASRETRTLTRLVAFVAGNGSISTTGLTSATTNNKAYGRATNIQLFAVAAVGGAATNMSCDYVLIGKP